MGNSVQTRKPIGEVVELIPAHQLDGFVFRTTAPDRPWHDISYELEREYDIVTGSSYDKLVVQNPAFLDVSGSGHRIVSQNGNCHWISHDVIIAVSWRVREGAPHFVLNSNWREIENG